MKKILFALSLVAVTCFAEPTGEPPQCPFDVKKIDIDKNDPKYRTQLHPVEGYWGWFIQTDELNTVHAVYQTVDESGITWEHHPQSTDQPEDQTRSLGCHTHTTVWVRPSSRAAIAHTTVHTAAACCLLGLFCCFR